MEMPKGRFTYTVPAIALLPSEMGISFSVSARTNLEQREEDLIEDVSS